MKFILRLIFIAAFSYLLPFYTPWWIIFIIAFLGGLLIKGNGFNAFNSGFLAGGMVWLGLSFKLDMETSSILSQKIVELFPITDTTLLHLVAGLIGAFSAGFASLTGASFRQIFEKKKQKSFYS